MLPIDMNQTRAEVSQGYGLPSVFYTSREVLSLERKNIFGSSWQYAVHRDQLKTPNSYTVSRMGEFSVILTKDAAGSIHAFRNVCLHRGAPIAKCSGTGPLLRCPYHSWTYSLDGKVRAAPGFQDDPRVRLGMTELQRARVAEFGPFIFVNLSQDGPELAEVLAPIRGVESKWETLKWQESRSYRYECNWKTAIENSLECYHCPSLHPGVIGLVDLQKFQFSVHGMCAIAGAKRRENVRKEHVFEAATDPGESENNTYFVWPNLWLISNPGPSNLIIARWLPEGIESVVCIRDFYFGEDFPEEKRSEFIAYIEQVQLEDISMCNDVFRNISTGAFERSLLRPHNSGLGEHGIQHFQGLVLNAIMH